MPSPASEIQIRAVPVSDRHSGHRVPLYRRRLAVMRKNIRKKGHECLMNSKRAESQLVLHRLGVNPEMLGGWRNSLQDVKHLTEAGRKE